MEAKDSPVQASSSQTWVEALTEYEAWFYRQALAISWARRVAIVLLISLIAFNLDIQWGYKFLGLAVLVGLSFIPKPRRQATNIPFDSSQDLGNRVAASGLIEKIRSSSLNNEDIRKDTNLVFRWLVPKLTGKKVDLLKRVGASLEWYLVPPKVHYRKSWTFGIWFFLWASLLTFFLVNEGLSVALSWRSLFWAILFFPFFSSMEIDRQFEGSRVFIRFLKSQLKLEEESVETTQIVQDENMETGSMLHRNYNMDLIINQCDKFLDHYKQQPLVVAISIFPFLLLLGILQQPNIRVIACTALFVVFVVVVGVLIRFLEKKTDYLQKENKQRLTNSDLAVRLVLGGATKAQLKAHIPPLLRVVPDGIAMANLPTGEGAEISADIICVALNLDWYLEHPKPLIRPVWVSFPILFLAGAGFAAAYVFSNYSHGTIPIWAWVMLGTAGLAFWVTMLQASVRMRAGSLALIEHLREGRA